MNARKIWTELFQKPAGRLVLFLLVGGIFVAFILTRRGPQPKPDNTPVASQATQAKSYSFKEDIKPLSRTEATPSPREPGELPRAPHRPQSRRHPSRRRSSPQGNNPSANTFCHMAGCFAANW